MSLVSENVFNATQALLVPVIPTTLSLLALDQVVAFLSEGRWRKLTVLPFFTMVDRRRRMHRDLVEDGCAARPGMLRSWIAAAADVERMGPHQAPVGAFAPRSPAAAAYADLWREVRDRIS
jgi:cellulose biosynthesis protein BcsQ